MANTGELVSRIYSNFRGVDFRGEEINLVRSPDSLNVWKDYKYTESIRTRPGLKLYMEKHKYDGSVYGIHFYHDTMIVHCGEYLYKVQDGQTEALFWPMNKATSDSFVFEDLLYIKDGKNYLRYDGNTVLRAQVRKSGRTSTQGDAPSLLPRRTQFALNSSPATLPKPKLPYSTHSRFPPDNRTLPQK